MQKILLFFLMVLFLLFQYQIYFGKGGNMDNKKIQQQIYKQEQINIELERRNKHVFSKIESLKGKPDDLEAKARFELNLIKPDETLILFPNNL